MTSAITLASGTAIHVGRRGALHAFGALLLRDVRVLRRNTVQFMARTVMQPLMFVFVFNYVFPKIGQGIGGPESGGSVQFSTVLVPGMMAMAIIFQGIQSVALPLVQDFSYTKEIEDRVLAPLPVWAVGAGKIVAGALQSLLAAIVVFPIVRFVHAADAAPEMHVDNWALFITVLLGAAFMGASVGMLIGTSFAPQQVPLIFSIIVLPVTMLGCVYYPWAALEPIRWLKLLVLVNPLVYMSEGLRAALTPGVPHMSPWAFFTAMIVATFGLGTLALRKFRSRVVA